MRAATTTAAVMVAAAVLAAAALAAEAARREPPVAGAEGRGDDPLAPRGKSFEVLSKPQRLGFGQVFNDFDKPLLLPKHAVEDMARGDSVMTSFKADVVEFSADGEVLGSTPLYDCYNHHFGVFLGRNKTMWKLYDYFRNHGYLGDATDSVGYQAKEHTQASVAGLGLAYTSGSGYRKPGRSLPMKHVQALMKEFARNLEGDDEDFDIQTNFVGGGSGAEERGTKHVFPRPYGMVLPKGTDSVMPLMHLINTRGDVEPGTIYSRLAECPCSSDRAFDLEAGTIDGAEPNIPFACSSQMLLDGNTGCSLDTYTSGFRCCEHGVWVSEPEQRSGRPEAYFGMRFTFYYEPKVEESIPLIGALCCDATASVDTKGQIEYDIPKCKEGEECVHTLVGYQYLDVPGTGFGYGELTPEVKADIDAGRQYDLISIVGHQHMGASPLGIKLYKHSTNELICESKPMFGNGTEPGNENGYLVGMSACTWGGETGLTPPRLRRDDVMRIESSYDNTSPHYGVMSLWLVMAAKVPLPGEASAATALTLQLQ